MKVVSVKFEDRVLKEVDENIKSNNFNSRTEFIRGAIRDKLDQLRKEKAFLEFLNYKGKADKKTTDKENLENKKEIEKQLLKELENRFK